MPGDDDAAHTNIGVIVSRLNRLEHDHAELGSDFSELHERLNYLERDKLSRAEFVEWTENAQAWREQAIEHFARIDGRLGTWAGGSVVLTIIAGVIAAVVGRAP